MASNTPHFARFAKAMMQTGLWTATALSPLVAHGQPVNDRIVWAHQMGVMPNDSSMQYGSTYPIVLYDRNSPTWQADVHRQAASNARNSGANGIAFEITTDKVAHGPAVPQYEGMVKLFAGSGIPVAPCIDIGSSPDRVDDIIRTIEQSYVVAKNNGNPALMPDGRLIVFLYSANHQSPEVWARIRAKVNADGYKVFLVGDAAQANISPAKAMANTATLVTGWDAAFNFNGTGMAGAPDSNANFGKAVTAQRKMWVASLMPGYYRGVGVNPAHGAFYVDALATARLRTTWQDILQSNFTWAYWITNNDYIEHTNLIPDSSWGYTRSDMNLWYARQLTGGAYPLAPALYLTTPQALHINDQSVVELAAINPLGTPLTATVQLVADNGDVLGSARLQGGAHRLDAIQIPMSGSAAAGHTSVRAIARGPAGTLTSAPILLSREPRLTRDHGGTSYYSTNSRLTAPAGWHPAVAVQGNAVTLSRVDPSTILSADLLASGNLVDQVKFPRAGTITLSKTRVLQFGRDTNDNKNSVLYSGPPVYLLRVVLKNGAIWYSDPLPGARPAP